MGNITERFEKYKILYLLALAASLFLITSPGLLASLLVLQIALWTVTRLPLAGLATATRRLWIFFLLIGLSFGLVGGPGEDWRRIPLGLWSLPVNLSGLTLAGIMCLRVLVLVLASVWVQQTSPPGALARGLARLRVPEAAAIAVDATLAILSSQGPGGGGRGGGGGGGRGAGRGVGRQRQGAPAMDNTSLNWSDIRRGRLQLFAGVLERSLGQAQQWLGNRYPEMDAARLKALSVVLAVSVAIMGLKVLQVLPGIPFASGHKNLLIVPLLLFAAQTRGLRLGGFTAGTAAGIVSFLLGYGKFGVLEIAHFALPGLLADLLLPLARGGGRVARLIQFAAIGAVMGASRFAANFLAILLAGAPDLAFVLFAPLLASQVIFGALSSFVCIFILPPPATDPDSQQHSPPPPA